MTAQRMYSIPAQWRAPLLLALAAFIILLLLFHRTVWSIVDIWLNDETYNHGFIILPIALWLAWDKRRQLARLTPAPTLLALPLFVLCGLLWGVAHLVGVQVVTQLAFVAMLISALWSILGHGASRVLAFPLLFLFLAVPMGQGLVPPMMEFTASFTVKLLQLTGVPVYREGLMFSLPSGNWSVVEACSGVRYIIASVTLGLLYAYLSYRSLWRRALFVLLSFLVPILANGLRAYMIVMIGHLSDMKLAVGVDHLIYGWIFFGLVMLLLFWIGSWWAQPEGEVQAAATADMPAPALKQWFTPGLLLLLLAVSIQTGVAGLASRADSLHSDLSLPPGGNGWSALDSAPWSWQPAVHGAAQQRLRFYRKNGERVGLFVALYPSQSQDHEAVSSLNSVVHSGHQGWRILRQGSADASLAGGKVTLNSYDVASSPDLLLGDVYGRELKVWQWYRLGERTTANPYVAKLYQAWNRLYPGRADGAYIAVAAEQDWRSADRAELLQAFIDDMMPAIEQAMAASLGRD